MINNSNLSTAEKNGIFCQICGDAEQSKYLLLLTENTKTLVCQKCYNGVIQRRIKESIENLILYGEPKERKP